MQRMKWFLGALYLSDNFGKKKREEQKCKIMTVTFVMKSSDVVLAGTGTQARLSRVVPSLKNLKN
jgi:hypothetical protein